MTIRCEYSAIVRLRWSPQIKTLTLEGEAGGRHVAMSSEARATVIVILRDHLAFTRSLATAPFQHCLLVSAAGRSRLVETPLTGTQPAS